MLCTISNIICSSISGIGLQGVHGLFKEQNAPSPNIQSLLLQRGILPPLSEYTQVFKINFEALKSDKGSFVAGLTRLNATVTNITKEKDTTAFFPAWIVLLSNNNGKVFISCFISKNLVETKGINASEIIKDLSPLISGSGGGQAFYATGGGSNLKGISSVISRSEEIFNQI